MPFARPTLDELRRRIAQDVQIRLPGVDALLRWNNLSIIGEVEAGLAHLLYGRLAWSFLQLFPDTADAEYLERWASIYGVQRGAASRAEGNATWPALASSSIPVGAIAIRGDGTRFTVDRAGFAEGDEPDIAVTVHLTADLPGVAGNSAPDVQLTLATTQPGVTPLGRVAEPGIAGGAPIESDAQLRQRLLLRIRMPPHGGSADDYLQWTLAIPGVERAWVYPLEQGNGTVSVRFMMDPAIRPPDGIPTQADVELVRDHLVALAPVTARIHVYAPAAEPLDFIIQGLEPDTVTIRAGIEAELRDLMRTETEPTGLLHLNRIFARINAAPGVRRFHLVQPTADVQATFGHITTLGSITYHA